MAPSMSNRLLPCLAMAVMVVMMVFGVTKADTELDKNNCTVQLVGLTTCLPYVGGEAPAPPKDCCTGLKQVLTKSMVCLCILIKELDDPSLQLKINDTLALGLPDSCNTPTNFSTCVSLLHLQPGSQDAKVFEDYAKRVKSNTTTIVQPGDGMKANSTSSDGGRRDTSLGLEIVGLLFIVVMLHFNVHNEILNYQW